MNFLLWYGAFSALWYTLLLLTLDRQWLSRFPRGFLLTLFLSFTSTGVGAAALMAVWNYQAATDILNEQTGRHLQDVGRIVSSDIDQAVALALVQMRDAARELGPYVENKTSTQAEQALQGMRQANPLLLDAGLYDVDGRPITKLRPNEAHEPVKVALAFALDGSPFRHGPYYSARLNTNVLLLAVPVQSPDNKRVGAFAARFDVETSLERRFASTRFGQSGLAVLTNGKGLVIAHSDPARRHDDISTYPAVQRALRGERGFLRAGNKAGERRLFFYEPLKNPDSLGADYLALLTEMRTEEAAAPVLKLLYHLLIGAGIILVAAVFLGVHASGYIERPLRELASVVSRVRQGDLSARCKRRGSDEIGRLAAAVDAMIGGLEERDRIKELFGRYVTTQVSEEVLKGNVDLGGEQRRVTILFSDIRDFTSISEQMAPRQVVTFLNEYFSEMVEAVFQYGGVLDKFIGDGMLAVFGSFGDEPDHPQRAVMAALRMKALLAKINGERAVTAKMPIRIGIGIHTDEVIVGNIGSHKRLEYTVIGDGVNTTSRVEALNKQFGTTILITETTYAHVKDSFDCRPMPDAVLKGKTRAIQFYEVLSAKVPASAGPGPA